MNIPEHITALIPAYNEEQRVATVVQTCTNFGIKVVVVDDGSSDNTSKAAQQAGATVIRMPENQGKGASLKTGLQHISTPFTLMLDADLINITQQHLQDLVHPVLEGELDMAIGVFKSGKALTDFGNQATPHLSGQRAASTAWFLSVPNLDNRWPEPAITEHIQQCKLKWRYIDLLGAGQVMKEQKRGWLAGFAARISMYLELINKPSKH